MLDMSTKTDQDPRALPKKPAIRTAGQKMFDQCMAALNAGIARFDDPRAGRHNTKYSMREIALGAFSVFFMRNESFLESQRNLESAQGINNLRCLFGVDQIPTDNHIRNILDTVPPQLIESVFKEILSYLSECKIMEDFHAWDGHVLIALDGTQYHSSKNICCEQCSKAEHKNGSVTYSHTAILPVIVKPGKSHVLSLFPEFVVPQDGHEKQDCEIAAAKRLICRNAEDYRKLNTIILGDDLYSNQPFCTVLIEEKLDFIFTCKPTSHKIMFGLIDELSEHRGVEELKIQRKEKSKFVTDTYRFVDKIPIRGGADALDVNWFELTTTDGNGKILYHNSFATSLCLTKENIVAICECGRARWKIENENNNVLKNLGYNLEHNFGHGQQHLSSMLATLNIIAFLTHTAIELVDADFQKLVSKLKRSNVFKHVAVLTCYVCYGGLQDLLRFMTDAFDQLNLPPKTGEIFYHPAFHPPNDSS